MKDLELFTITEFVQFSRTTRGTLVHYDKIGLIEPVSRGENNYRYYSGPQLGAVNLVRTCQEMGMPLSEIVDYKNHRSAEAGRELMARHIAKIEEAITQWRESQKLLATLMETIDGVRGVDESAVEIRHMPEERIILGHENDYSGGRNANDALLRFYRAQKKENPKLNLNYPVWGFYSEERIKNRDWKWPSKYYFYNPEGQDKKPEGEYAVGYVRGGYGESDELYRRMLAYIDERGYEICGPAYEEYPLNEITVDDPYNYLMRVSIRVRRTGEG